MATTAANVRVGITGGLYKAPLGTTAPTDATTSLAAGFVELGFLNDDGLAENWEDSVNDIISWQNAATVRSAVTESKLSLEATLIETTGVVLEMYHRGSSIVTSGSDHKISVKPVTPDPAMWVLDVVDGTKLIRLFVGQGEVVERGEVMYKNGEPVGYPITLRGYPDASGNICEKFSNDAAWAVA